MSATTSGSRSLIRSTSSRNRTPSASASARTARSEAAAATTAGRFPKPGARPDSRSSAGPPVRTAPLAHRQQPHAGRAAPLVGAGGQQRPGARDRTPGERLGGVHQQRDGGRPAGIGDLLHRLDGAHLVVGRLEAGERGVGPQGGGERLGRDPAGALHADPADLAARRLEKLRRVQHRGVLDLGDDEVAADPAAAGQGPRDAGVDRLCPRRGEDQLVRAAAHRLGRALPGGVQQEAGAAALPVQPGRVGPALVEGGQEGLAGRRMQGAADAASK